MPSPARLLAIALPALLALGPLWTLAQGFIAPMDGPLLLSGNFGEVRSDHFHTGLDIKTGGQEGRPVRAIADGWVSRVAVSPTGYGKAIYIDHPNGHTSVYAHLRAFMPQVAAHVKQEQYARESFTVDITLSPGRFPVRQGDIIGQSGNSGSSGGPHLHFEIRQTDGQVPLNPLSLGISVADTRPPDISALHLYLHHPMGHVEGTRQRQFALKFEDGRYRLHQGDTLRVLGPVSLGIAASDRFSGSDNRCGIHSMTVTVDGQPFYGHSIDRLPFDRKRMVNASLDYPQWKASRKAVHRTYIAPGNRLDIYKGVKGRGMIAIGAGEVREVSVHVSDFAGNAAPLGFVLIGQGWASQRVEAALDGVREVFLPDHEGSFSTEDFRITVPALALYDTLLITYGELPPCQGCLTPVHVAGPSDVPLDDYVTVSVRLPLLPRSLSGKLVAVALDKDGSPSSLGGEARWQWLTAKTRSLGPISVMADTIAPELRPKNFRSETETARIDTLVFHLRDDLSGIKSWRATLNGKWVLMEHDPKNSVLYYVKDERFVKGQNTLIVSVSDACGNITEHAAIVH